MPHLLSGLHALEDVLEEKDLGGAGLVLKLGLGFLAFLAAKGRVHEHVIKELGRALEKIVIGGDPIPFRLPRVVEPTILDQLEAELVVDPEQIQLWNKLVCEHHYLKNANLVGEQLRYVLTYQGQWAALLGWSAASFHLRDREKWLRWSNLQRRSRLHLLAQNSRFVVLVDRTQWPNLARFNRLLLRDAYPKEIDTEPKPEIDWLATSRAPGQMGAEAFLDKNRQYWGIENGTHQRLDCSALEDRLRIHEPNAVEILGFFHRVSLSLFVAWADQQPNPRDRTYPTWQADHQANRWIMVHQVTKAPT